MTLIERMSFMSKSNIRLVTVALLLSNVMSGIDSTIVNTALPAIIADLHGLQLMAWIVAVFLLGTAVSTLLWSKLGQRTAYKFAYQLAALTFVVGSLLQGLSPNIWVLIITRGIAGIGNGGMISLPYIMFADLYPNVRDRMKTLGLVSGFYSFATIIGPLVGGFLVDTLSWHWIFYINVPIGLLSILLVQIYYKVPRSAAVDAPLDVRGSLALVVLLVSLLGAIELIGMVKLPVILALVVLAVLAMALLLRAEKHAADPVIPLRLFRNFPLVMDFLLFTLIWGAFVSFLTYAPMWAQGLLGTTALLGGATQIPAAFTNVAGSESVPMMRRRYTPHQVLTFNILMLTISFVLMAVLNVHAPFWLLLVAGAFEGWGNGACFNELQVKVQVDAEKQDVSVATSFSFLIRMLSQTFTVAIFGLLMNQQLAKGVAAHPGITMAMMNKLSDSNSAASLPNHLLPAMRQILFSGLHNIMLLALALMLISLALNFYAQHKEANLAAPLQ